VDETNVEHVRRFGTTGVIQLAVTWILAAPPLFFLMLGLVGPALSNAMPQVVNAGTRALAVPMLIIGVCHWGFTGAAVLSSAILVLRVVPAGRKRTGSIAAALSVCASLYIRQHNQL
jgi:hypothetical protein